MREFEGIENIPENFEFLYNSHENYTFEENLDRLVEATNNIAPTGKRFVPTELQVECIRESVDRAISFLNSVEYGVLNDDLNDRVRAVESGQFKPGCVQCSIDNSCPAQELLNIGRGGILVV